MTAVYLTEADVTRLLDMRTAIDAVEEAFRRLAAGEADNVPRQRAKAPRIVLHSMSAALPHLGLVGWKCYTTTRHGAQFLVGLYEMESGRLAALVEADRLGRVRTGAVTGLAAEYMAPLEASEAGLFGTGHQAETQLAALAEVRQLKRVFVYSRDQKKRENFADRMSEQLGLEISPVDRPQEAAEELPLVVTATNSAEPVFDGHWLAEGSYVAAVGSNWLTRAEIDSTVVRRADNIVCDSIVACQNEAGDFVDALQKGIFDWSRAVELADVVTGRAVGRGSPQSLTLFKSVGLALEDVAVGGKLLELARREGIGTPLPF